jgi:protein involved in polysaccharide export with SLBB domain
MAWFDLGKNWLFRIIALLALMAAPSLALAQGGIGYKLGVGDKVKVIVFGQADLTGETEVDASGKIVVGLIGEVQAQGRTLAEVQGEIRQRLDKEFLVNPRVSLVMVAYRPITVLGYVKTPGRYPYSSGMDVRQAVGLAGGYDRRASSSSVTIFRDGKEFDAKPETAIEPGDTIQIPRSLF